MAELKKFKAKIKYSFLILVSCTLFSAPFFANAVNYGSEFYSSGLYSATQPAPPIASPVAGIYNSVRSVTLSATSSSIIRYSSSAIPSSCSSDSLYSAPLTISYSQTIYVRACNSVGNFSTSSFSYIIDGIAPIISAISVNSTNSSAAISWHTNKPASSMIDYGATSSYGASTALANIAPRVSDHNILISNLSPCTTYHYKVRSSDSALNESASPDQTFATTGCSEDTVSLDAAPINFSTAPILSAAPIVPGGGFATIANGNKLIFNAGMDVKKMAISLSRDFSTASIEDYVPDKEINICTSSCTVYIKFFTASGGASDIIEKNIIIEQKKPAITPPTPPIISPSVFPVVKELKPGAQDSSIKSLQKFLNQNGYKIAATGNGSLGQETDYFGALTTQALIKFQINNKLTGEKGYLGVKTQEFINSFKNTGAVASATKILTLKSTLSRGSKSNEVAIIQEWLASTDLYPEKLITGYFGTATERAIKKFQLKYGIVTSEINPGYGIVGPNTRKKLLEIFDK